MLDRVRSLAILVVCLILSQVSAAQARPDTWVAPHGADTGTCPSTAPCRTFAYAYTQTSVDGSINVASSGTYGPLTISKGISIVADGVQAAIINAAGGAAIKVQAPGAIVSLRGLTIDMRGTANDGIALVAAEALHVHQTTIRRAARGISVTPASGKSELYIADTTITDTFGGDTAGIDVRPTGTASITAAIKNVRVENGEFHGIIFNGFATTGAMTATVSDSIVAGNNQLGIAAIDDASGGTRIMIERSAAVNSGQFGIGIFASGAGATIWIGNSTVSGNQDGLLAANGDSIRSYATNKVNGNTNDGAPTSTVGTR